MWKRVGAKYAIVGCMYAERFGCMYAVVGCMYMGTFGCKYADFGCMYAETLGCKVCGCWVHVYGAVGCLHDCLCLPDSR